MLRDPPGPDTPPLVHGCGRVDDEPHGVTTWRVAARHPNAQAEPYPPTAGELEPVVEGLSDHPGGPRRRATVIAVIRHRH